MPIPRCLVASAALSALALSVSAAPMAADPAPGAQDAAAGAADATRKLVIGSSLSGIELEATILALGDRPLEERRGLLVVAGLDGRRLSDQQILRRALQRIADRDDLAEVLGDDMLVFVGRANPSGRGGQSMGDVMPPPATEGNRRRLDNDRDGRIDEDGPSDLDGDQQIAWMRVPDGSGEWVVDEHDPRAMRKARTERGERGTHRLIREGLDDDGDGAWNEDAGNGVILNANFPHGWDEYPADTGTYPLSEPETRALVDFVLAHPGLLGVVVIGEEDTLVSVPSVAKKVERGGFGGGFRASLNGLLEEDVDSLKELKRRIEELSEEAHDVKGDGPVDGGFLAWAYHQGGRWPLGLRPWSAPEKLEKKKEEDKKEGDDDGDAEEESAESEGDDPILGFSKEEGEESEEADEKPKRGGGRGKGKKKDDDEEEDGPASDKDSPVPAAVLEWLDEHADGEGVLPWTSFEHPELGEVEIGGLTLHSDVFAGRIQEDIDSFADQLGDMLVETLGWFPEVALEDLEITSHGDGLYSIEVAVVNSGVLPTSTQLGADARITRAIRVRLQLPPGVERLTGPQQQLVRRLEGGGGREELRWMIGGGSTGTQLVLSLDADTVEDLELKVVLP